MFEIFIYPLAFIVALGVLVTVHEYGHFWVARKMGVKVIRFSIGFGKALWKRTGKDGVEYVVAVLPLGGYVKMVDEREGNVSEADLPHAFNRQSLGARAAIVIAGPAFNFLFAVFAYWMIFMLGQTGWKPFIDTVEPDSIAYVAGIEGKTQIMSVGGVETPTWSDVFEGLLSATDGESLVELRLEDDNGFHSIHEIHTAKLLPYIEDKDFFKNIGITRGPILPPVMGEIIPGDPADNAGMRKGDLVTHFDGIRVASWFALVTEIQKSANQSVFITVLRDKEVKVLSLNVGNQDIKGKIKGRIGAGVYLPENYFEKYRTLIQFGPIDALFEGIEKTWDMSVLMLKMLWRLVTGLLSVEKNLGSVITIAHAAGTTAEYGLTYFLGFLAGFSITLGVMNLLPIPVLDGGHLFYYLIEAVTGKPVSEKVMLIAQQFGMALLMTFMVFALYIDVVRWVG